RWYDGVEHYCFRIEKTKESLNGAIKMNNSPFADGCIPTYKIKKATKGKR
ncbi:unnamed protein product, partial [marine sediment metagenome]